MVNPSTNESEIRRSHLSGLQPGQDAPLDCFDQAQAYQTRSTTDADLGEHPAFVLSFKNAPAGFDVDFREDGMPFPV